MMISKEENTKIKQLLDILEAEPSAFDFLEPVDYVRKKIIYINILYILLNI
jgi:hypothetical protein